jgi:hypothetical protein
MVPRLPSLVAVTALLSGCASVDDGQYPSLERRAVEATTAAPVPAPVAPTATPASESDRAAIAALAAQAQGGESAFRAALPAAQRRIEAARGAATGSDRWFDAQAALSALEATRAPTLAALSELDRRALAAEMDGQTGLVAALTPEQQRAADWASGQTATLNRLSALLGN